MKFQIEFEADVDLTETWWDSLQAQVASVICGFVSPTKEISFVYSEGDITQAKELARAEKASDTLLEILRLLKTVDPDKRDSIIKVLGHTRSG